MTARSWAEALQGEWITGRDVKVEVRPAGQGEGLRAHFSSEGGVAMYESWSSIAAHRRPWAAACGGGHRLVGSAAASMTRSAVLTARG
eukprot:CAMPEP_0203910774 /NCGR_PEP_ID=MMETSP0359-20131031/52009_1 /ASSEMBLY_ACC=CAM_ASM_000338 /TAXON_ID=268821 /ORGANISM="Scrippsiella Hangoei, Strain SHTV-5" /LENGTH=87 /DNA_ID=CAMNT_0050836325 /DNA_START=14 /DNA_END=275 /DNA_ORIENTATION=-